MAAPAFRSSVARSPRAHGEGGVALVLALIFSILLYVLVAELVVAGRMVRATGENDALLARMRTQMAYQLNEAEAQLLADLASASAEGEGEGGGGAGGLGGMLGGAGGQAGGGQGAGGQGGAGGEGEEAPPDPASKCDGSRDAWFQPIGKPDGDLTTYVWVEDENRKLNLLALWSPDEKFAQLFRERVVRMIDALREDTEFDVPIGDAERIVSEIVEWGTRAGSEQMPKPLPKVVDEQRRDVSGMMHLDELLLPSVTEDLFFDKVIDGKVYLGLESTLTIWTALRVDPGNPEKIARQRAAAESRGEAPGAGGAAAGGAGAAGSGVAPGGGQGGAGEAGQGGAAGPGGAGGAQTPTPEGLGILINVNTAPRAVLRSLFSAERVPDRVVDGIVAYRNQLDEEAMEAAASQTGGAEATDFGDMQLGADKKLKVFETLADLDKVEEWKGFADADAKAEFQAALTTKSEVFAIHVAPLFKRSEENRIYVMRRARSIVLRVEEGDGSIVPIVPFEERIGLRVMPVDLQDDVPDLTVTYSEMDRFSQEERAWNPFLIDFYLPKSMREQFYTGR